MAQLFYAEKYAMLMAQADGVPCPEEEDGITWVTVDSRHQVQLGWAGSRLYKRVGRDFPGCDKDHAFECGPGCLPSFTWTEPREIPPEEYIGVL